MAATTKVYSHAPRAWRPEPGAPVECRVCGVPVIGYDPAKLLHIDERPPPAPGGPGVAHAAQIVEEALSRLPNGRGPNAAAEAAQTAVEALYWCGALKADRERWRPPQREPAA
jgi:hypothetical protein